MHEIMSGPVHVTILLLELAAAVLLILGFLIATVTWFRRLLSADEAALHSYRHALGRVILIGLEVLVAATIIKTIAFDPTVDSMAMVVILVAIRTAIGWTTSLEINGRWPWQR